MILFRTFVRMHRRTGIIIKDSYEVTASEIVWTQWYEDPDTGEIFRVVIEDEKWTEI
jgi:hypothetical protein